MLLQKQLKPLKFTIKYVDKLNDRYSFIININNNVTPAKDKKEVAYSTVRQYIQIGNSLGLLERKNSDITSKCDSKVYINPKFWQINSKNVESELTDLFLITLLNSLNSRIEYQRNLGISIFLSLIDTVDDNIFDQLDDSFYLKPKTGRNKYLKNNTIYLNTENGKQFIKHIRGIDTLIYGKGKKTYIELCEKLLDKYSFDDIINEMFNVVHDQSLNIDHILNKKIKENSKKWDILDKYQKEIQNKRIKLRENIKINRVATQNDIKYTDLENSKNNFIYVQSQDACHIYDINKIKMDLRNYIENTDLDEIDYHKIDEILNKADDFNNGLLLNKICHNIFDKNYVWFDEDGKLFYLEECKDLVKEAFGENLDKIRIKDSTLSHAMREYLNSRNNFNIK